MLNPKPRLIFDIETVGKDFEELDKKSQEYIKDWAKLYKDTEESFEERLERKKDQLAGSPLTAQIVAIAILEADQEKGACYFQAPKKKVEAFEEDRIKYQPATEKEILENFWRVIKTAGQFATFNGRGFDCPFIIIRSAIHGIKSTVNLMPYRYKSDFHVDLMDQLSFYGAVRKKGNLHFWCQAFGIESSKDKGITGLGVKDLFKKKEYLKIARYCLDDVRATKELFHIWDEYIRVPEYE